MILGFNIGNTHTVMGIYCDGNPQPLYMLRYPTDCTISSATLSSIIQHAVDQWQEQTFHIVIEGAIYSSVVPPCNAAYDESIQSLYSIKPHRITHISNIPITLEYDNPQQLGADRIVNATAAYIDYHTNCIIVDIGTAITFCYLQGNTFKGGIIAPGTGAAIRGLSESAAQLFDVPFEKPPHIIATNTKDALVSGFFYGWISLIEGIIQKVKKSTNTELVILTGGMAQIIAPHLSIEVVIDSTLTMRGIYYIYKENIKL